MQLTNANLPGWMIMAEGLGMTVQELRAAVQDGVVDAETGIAGLLTGLKKYEGMMDQISTRTVSGLWSNIKDTFNIKVIERWGAGLKDGALDAFTKMAEVLDTIDPHLKDLGNFLYNTGNYLSGKFTKFVDASLGRLVELLDSDEFKNADMFGKFELAWDKLIAEPFTTWWNDSGKETVEKALGDIGTGLGKGVTKGICALLGLDVVGAAGDGVDIGEAFTEGFIDGLDTDAIKEAFLKVFDNIAKDALKVLPGGDSPTTSSWISAILLGVLGKKLGVGKLLGGIGNKVTGGKGASALFKGVSPDDFAYLAWLQKNANPKGKTSWLEKLGKAGTWLGGLGSKLSGSKVGSFFKNNWLSLLLSGAAIYSSDDKAGTAVQQGFGLAGSAGGGSLGSWLGGLLGTAIMPGAGTAVGSGIGGLLGSFLGYMGGEKGGGWLWDKAKTWWGGDYDPEKGVFAGGGKDFFGQWGKDIAENANSVINQVKTDLIDPAGQFFTETLPGWWGEKLDAVGTFFGETLPEWWGEKVDAVGTFFEETLPEWWGEKIEAIGGFFTETLPGWWDEHIGGPFSEVCASFKTTIESVSSWFTEKKEAITGWFEEKKEAVSTWWEETVGEHATGGIFSSPHLGLVAEDGPEAIIPLGAKRRQRGLDLWRKAGAAMGVTAYADGGIIGAVSSGGGSINVGGVTVNITVDGGSGTLVEALNSQSEEIKEAIAGILYDALSSSFNNRPITA